MAYAAVLSLMQILQQIKDPDRYVLHEKQRIESFQEKIPEQIMGAVPNWVLHSKQQIECLQEKFGFLRDFLEEFSISTSTTVKDMEIKIRDAAYNTEDIIESYVCDLLLPESDEKNEEEGYRIFCQGLEKAIEETCLIQEGAMEIRGNIIVLNDVQQRNCLHLDRSRLAFSGKSTTMVGFDDDLNKIKDWLMSSSSELEVISIVGMGGIGKTTLARNDFDDPHIVSHFDIRSWVTVSQEYQVRDILAGLLRHSTIELSSESEEKLSEADRLYKCLKGRRYLIVMDDLWETKVWDDVKRFFPDDNNGSRIILTTRLMDVGVHAATRNRLLNLSFISSNESWNLLCKKVFGEESCPHYLAGIGQKIASHCQGLPLSIVVIGGLLSMDKTVGYWETIARSVNSFLATDGNQCSEILSLSYNHLPAHLKPCFLYFAAFPEDYDIRKSKLINLWVAEGFLKPLNSYSLEDIAERYLEDLVNRNLIMVSGLGYGGKVKAYKVHDLLRDFCMSEVQKTKFLHIIKYRYPHTHPLELRSERRISIQTSSDDPKYYHYLDGPAFLTRSFHHFCNGTDFSFMDKLVMLRLLRILDMVSVRFTNFPSEVVKLKNLRYLSLHCQRVNVPELIYSIRGLQTLIVNTLSRHDFLRHSLPRTIWKMLSLRYVRIGNCLLPNLPIPPLEGKDFVGLTNLQTLKAIPDFRFTNEIIKRLPNLKKLKVYYQASKYWDYYELSNIVCLDGLESFEINSVHKIDFPENFKFPSSLKKLNLSGCKIPWDDLTMVGSLPKLEVLTLRDDACKGVVWEPNEGEFCELKFLRLDGLDMVQWRANDSHFPMLELLQILRCSHLEVIPTEIGNIGTLEMIELQNMNSSARTFAERILEEQRDLGNHALQVHIKKTG